MLLSPCCYAVVVLTASCYNTLPGLFKTDTNRAINDAKARIDAREVKQEDVFVGFCILNAPFLPDVSSTTSTKTTVPQEPITPSNPTKSTNPLIPKPEACVATANNQCESVLTFDDSISDSELASISSNLFKSNKNPTLVTPVKGSKKRAFPSSNNSTSTQEMGHKYDTRFAAGEKQKKTEYL